jgi:Txe/YoeB family toxin of Txe-Axe toxin-antitoxin module
MGPRRSEKAAETEPAGQVNLGKETYVGFSDEKLKQDYDELKAGKGAEPRLYDFLNRAFDDLKHNPFCGVKIPKKLWPKAYVDKYQIDNLWKYDLPNAWRLIYTIKAENVTILAVVLEWFDHKAYEKRFKY